MLVAQMILSERQKFKKNNQIKIKILRGQKRQEEERADPFNVFKTHPNLLVSETSLKKIFFHSQKSPSALVSSFS